MATKKNNVIKFVFSKLSQGNPVIAKYHQFKSSIISPLRYPGGKAAFVSFFAELMKINGLTGGVYIEPFAGGAGAALGLLANGAASEIVLNDADYHIFCFWVSVLNENSRFLENIESVSIGIDEWNKQNYIYKNPKQHSDFEVGFSTFYLNRCNRSGILSGAGPIGGYRQTGKWKMNARFNKSTLAKRISFIGDLRDRISVYNMDVIDLLREVLPKYSNPNNVLIYLDPPYISAGNKLYLNFYHESDHKRLADYLLSQTELKWIVTYDDTSFIRELYHSCQKWLFHLGYSLQSKQKGTEILISADHLRLPTKNHLQTKKVNILKQIIV